jgi:hypothetical protein
MGQSSINGLMGYRMLKNQKVYHMKGGKKLYVLPHFHPVNFTKLFTQG